MRYKAHFFDDLASFKLLNSYNGIGGAVGIAAGVGAHGVFYVFGLDFLSFFCLLAAFAVIYNLSPLGRVGWQVRRDYLLVERDTLHVQTRSGRRTARLSDLSPVAYTGSYRPLGFLPRVAYLRLQIDGGPLGPRELFFAHDGDYAAKTWAELGIETHPERTPTVAIA